MFNVFQSARFLFDSVPPLTNTNNDACYVIIPCSTITVQMKNVHSNQTCALANVSLVSGYGPPIIAQMKDLNDSHRIFMWDLTPLQIIYQSGGC